jgi:hypothetical protein
MSNKKAKAQTSIEMTASANRLFRLGGQRSSTDTGDTRLNELNARLNALNESIEELAIELLDNTTDQPSSYYSGSLKKLNAEEAALIKAEIEAEMNDA